MRIIVTDPGRLVHGTVSQVDDATIAVDVTTTDPTPPPPPPKTPNVGFVLRDKLTQGAFSSRASFTNVSWADLEPTQGAYTGPGWATIDALLGTFPPGHTARLRLYAGVNAPAWAKQLGGAAITLTNPGIPETGTVPRWWTPEFLAAYDRLMAEVARRYDNDDRVADVVVSGAQTFNAEPFIRTGSDDASNQRLFQAGLNETVDGAAIKRTVEIHAQRFTRTRFSLATHYQWQVVNGTAPNYMALSWEKERAILNDLRALYGDRLVIQNNGAGSVPATIPNETVDAATSMWAWFKADPGPVGFQGGYKTAPAAQTLDRCVNVIGAWFFENISQELTDAQVNAYQQQMVVNAGA